MNNYFISVVKSNDEKFFEKCLPNDDKVHQDIVCNYLRELIKFESEIDFIAFKKYGTENYKVEIPGKTVKFVKEDNCEKKNYLLFSDGENNTTTMSTPLLPILTDEYISYNCDRYYPVFNSEKEVVGFTGYMCKKANIILGELLCDNINKICIKENEIIINEDLILPIKNKEIYSMYYWNNKIRGFIIDGYAFHFEDYNPDDYIDPENIIEKEILFNKLLVSNVSFKGLSMNEFVNNERFREGPKIPRKIEWTNICIDFPQESEKMNEFVKLNATELLQKGTPIEDIMKILIEKLNLK